MPSKAVESSQTPAAIVGCLLDVSYSMHTALESGKGDEGASERLHAVLRAALKLAKAEQQHNPNASMFIGAFGLKDVKTPVVDLCDLVDALVEGTSGSKNGHDLLVALANEKNLSHITRYVREKLTEEQARIVHAHLRRNPGMIQEFIDAIPSPKKVKANEGAAAFARGAAFLSGAMIGSLLGPYGMVVGAFVSGICGNVGVDSAQDRAIEDSKAIQLARRICREWTSNFKDLMIRPVSEVVPLLERVQEHPSFKTNEQGRSLLDNLRPYLYGSTPTTLALKKALTLFQKYETTKRRVLVMITDGESTDGIPLPLATELKQNDITIAGVYLTANKDIPHRRLYDSSDTSVYVGQQILFEMASKVTVTQHPIPVLAAMGWEIPSSGECALYTTVCTSDALEEFYSMLLTARFSSADALLDMVGKVNLDAYVDDAQVKTRNKSSDQGQSRT